MTPTFNHRGYENPRLGLPMAVALCGALMVLGACQRLSPEGERAVVGGGIGAAAGAVIGEVVADEPLAGAAIGGAGGAATGALTEPGTFR